jgi:hypothetical protein
MLEGVDRAHLHLYFRPHFSHSPSLTSLSYFPLLLPSLTSLSYFPLLLPSLTSLSYFSLLLPSLTISLTASLYLSYFPCPRTQPPTLLILDFNLPILNYSPAYQSMAILPGCPGLSVSIVAANRRLIEFDDDNPAKPQRVSASMFRLTRNLNSQ